jgi:hypothetical protein
VIPTQGPGTFGVPGSTEFVPAVQASVFSNAVGTSTQFVLSTRFDHSLISQLVAAQLGIDLTDLPLESLSTYFGDFSVPAVSLDYVLFATEGTKSNVFGILTDSINPGSISLIGNDILSTYGEYRINTVSSALEAAPVPEQDTLTLISVGIIIGVASSISNALRRQD